MRFIFNILLVVSLLIIVGQILPDTQWGSRLMDKISHAFRLKTPEEYAALRPLSAAQAVRNRASQVTSVVAEAERLRLMKGRLDVLQARIESRSRKTTIREDRNNERMDRALDWAEVRDEPLVTPKGQDVEAVARLRGKVEKALTRIDAQQDRNDELKARIDSLRERAAAQKERNDEKISRLEDRLEAR